MYGILGSRWTLLLCSIALAGGAGWWLTPAQAPLNVVIVVWDTVRADRLSPWGAERPTTPWLAEAVDRGVVFDNAHSPAVWTLPSHASMFTGLPAESTGSDERWQWLDDRHVTVAEHFAAHGYDTFAMAANPMLSDRTNLLQGFGVRWASFDGTHRDRAGAATLAKLVPGDRSQELAPDWVPPAHAESRPTWWFKEAAPLITEATLAWIDDRDDATPFFAYLNWMEAHTPRLPAMASRRAVIGDEATIERGLQTDAAFIRLHFANFGHEAYSPLEIEAMRAVYDATLRDLDDAMRLLFEGLERRDLLERTVVVLVSDHGESLGDHGLHNHRFGLWESLTHVPLVVWHPELAPERRREPVSTRDLFGTVARLAGIAVPRGSGDWWTAPSPVVAWLGEPLEREIQIVREVHPSVEIEPWMRSGHALVQGHHKLIDMSDDDARLYDLRADPHELRPLDAPVRRDQLARALRAYLEGAPRYRPELRTGADRPSRGSQDELREHLEALGYLSDE